MAPIDIVGHVDGGCAERWVTRACNAVCRRATALRDTGYRIRGKPHSSDYRTPSPPCVRTRS